MEGTNICKWLREVMSREETQNGEKIIEAVRDFLTDTSKLRRLPDVILVCFKRKEFPQLAEILAKALEASDPYHVETLTLIENLRERHSFRALRFAVHLRRCLA